MHLSLLVVVVVVVVGHEITALPESTPLLC